MTMNTKKQIPENLKAGLISVDSYENKTMSGRLRFGHQGKESGFDNLMQLLLLTVQALGEMDTPEEYVKCKSFSPCDFRENNTLCVPKEVTCPPKTKPIVSREKSW